MPTKQSNLSDSLFKLLGGLLLTGVTLFAGWVTSSIGVATKDITDLKIRNAHFDADLEIIDNKINLLLDMNGLEYTGPAFHQHNQAKQ